MNFPSFSLRLELSIGNFFRATAFHPSSVTDAFCLKINSFSGSKDYPRTGATLTYKNKVSIFTISAGAEYNFFPKKKFDPFVGLDLAVNFFSGSITASGDSSFTIKRKSETRFGVIANAGVDIKLNKSKGRYLALSITLQT